MRYAGMASLILIFLVVGCSQTYTLDDARQVAVNEILINDRYTQNEVENFQIISEQAGDCVSCYIFEMSFDAKVEEKPNVDGYSATIQVKENKVVDIYFTELFRGIVIPIEETTDQLCVNKCGDGQCQEIVCQASGCPCSETKETCSEDC